MEKKFSKIEISTIKSIAKNVSPYVIKRDKLNAQIEEVEQKVAERIRRQMEEKVAKLNAEKASYQDIIDSMNATVVKMTGGFTTEDLVDRVVEGTGKMDATTGKEIMQTRYVLKYPETVVPVKEEIEAEAAPETAAEEGASEGVEVPAAEDAPIPVPDFGW